MAAEGEGRLAADEGTLRPNLRLVDRLHARPAPDLRRLFSRLDRLHARRRKPISSAPPHSIICRGWNCCGIKRSLVRPCPRLIPQFIESIPSRYNIHPRNK
ncbi:hypothetical protein DAI22_01g226750 [Oryza sativa Japonica Group]|nr:hypothetical protein DAI22_01g226750 [Oryza sativa Japonica Group]